VQALLSLQAVLSGALTLVHRKFVAALQRSIVQGLLSLQVEGHIGVVPPVP
jgi:hypothetical protein